MTRKKPVQLTKARQAKALALLESGEFICNVADQIGVTRQALFKLRKRDKAFRKAWDEAAAIGEGIQASLCEEEMDFRGRIGWLEPKFFEGRICDLVKKYSDARHKVNPQTGDVTPLIEDKNNHACDAVRYALKATRGASAGVW